jgi:hypothetical protein
MFKVDGVKGIEGLEVEFERMAAQLLLVWLRLCLPASQVDPVVVLRLSPPSKKWGSTSRQRCLSRVSRMTAARCRGRERGPRSACGLLTTSTHPTSGCTGVSRSARLRESSSTASHREAGGRA